MKILEHFLKFSEVALEPSGPIQCGFHSLWGKLGAVLGPKQVHADTEMSGRGKPQRGRVSSPSFLPLSALLRPQVAS